MGVIIGYYYNKFNKVDINLALILLIIGIVTLLASINPNSRMLNFDRFFIWGLPSALIVFGAIYCKQIKNKFLLYLGDASYSIYLVQILAIPGFYKLITYLDVKINYNFLSIICLISSVVFGCIFHTYIEKKIKLFKKR